jgi:hypothetical protein
MDASRGDKPTAAGDTVEKDRRGRRIALSCRLFFFGDDEFEGEGRILDISTHGCKAASTVPMKAGTTLRLSLFLPDHKWPLRVDQAIVRWVAGAEFGLEFATIRLAQRERLRALVMKTR